MSTLYATTSQTSTRWSESLEPVYQAQRRLRGARSARGHRPDITRSLRLLIASAVDLGDARPHGMITWLAAVLGTSRQTIYDIGETWIAATWTQAGLSSVTESPSERRNRIARAALTMLVVGAMRLRGVELCLEQLLGERRSLGWLSGLVDEAGQRAGAVLEAAEWTGSGEMITARDELFFGDTAWLLTVDARSHAIVSGYVENGVDAETWAVSLALDQLRTGHRIVGLAEDAGAWFPASIGLAQAYLDAPCRLVVQKDVWHLLDKAWQSVRDAERIALRRLAAAEEKARPVRPGFLAIRDFDGWEAAHARADQSIQHADTVHTAVAILHEALELVDRRTGAVLDRDTAGWYLEQIVALLRNTDNDLAESLAGSLERQAHELLTFHDWLAMDLAAWRNAALVHFEDAALVDLFERSVARAWQRSRAVTNGRTQLRLSAQDAAAAVQGLCHNDPVARQLADDLFAALDGTVRTSSAAENVNSTLRAYIWGRRAFKNRRTAQNWLNLLMLWYNLHTFQRGKRAGRSPFDLAGVVVRGPDGRPTKDWLTALGYAQAA